MKIYIWSKIEDKIVKKGIERYDIDIRYLQRHIKNNPECFPKCMISGNYTPVFNPQKYIWEIWYGKHQINFNPQNYLR